MKKLSYFTLIELLVVVSLVALIATGVTVTYSGVRNKATKQMTLKDMNSVREAFKVFYSDNYKQIQTIKGRSGTGDFLDYFQDYGLWGLFQKKAKAFDFEAFNPLSGNGWGGPYIEGSARIDKDVDGYGYPQPSDLGKNAYEVLKVEFSDSGTNYKRLLLVSTSDGTLDLTANSAENRINLQTGEVGFEGNGNDLTIELLNLDTRD